MTFADHAHACLEQIWIGCGTWLCCKEGGLIAECLDLGVLTCSTQACSNLSDRAVQGTLMYALRKSASTSQLISLTEPPGNSERQVTVMLHTQSHQAAASRQDE